MCSPRICVVVTSVNVDNALHTITRMEHYNPDLIEVRFDYMDSTAGFEKIREATNLPLIATNRSAEQGGLWAGSMTGRIALLTSASKIGFDYVDIELTTASNRKVVNEVREKGAKIIISYHDFESSLTLSQLEDILQKQLDLGADICKIVGTVNSYRENLVYLNFLDKNKKKNIVSFGMGNASGLSRIFSPLFGGAFTYASSDLERESAPGQFTLSTMREIYKLLRV